MLDYLPKEQLESITNDFNLIKVSVIYIINEINFDTICNILKDKRIDSKWQFIKINNSINEPINQYLRAPMIVNIEFNLK